LLWLRAIYRGTFIVHRTIGSTKSDRTNHSKKSAQVFTFPSTVRTLLYRAHIAINSLYR